MPMRLAEYPARTETNRRFEGHPLQALDRFFLPPSMTGLLDPPPLGIRTFLEDDNRGAIGREAVATLDGTPFYLSVKGVGSAVDPFAERPLSPARVAELTSDQDTRRRLVQPRVPPEEGEADRFLTGEVWLRGSPYGGQGLGHASIAMRVSERADLTDLEGFRLAPVVKIAYLPAELEERIRAIHWFRRFPGPIVQELRLVPSNIRIYFHSKSTLGTGPSELFDRFGLDSEPKAVAFEVAFLRSVVPLLTLFPRTLRRGADTDRYVGLDFHDVWLDKDAVIAPDGTVYFVDLEGIEEEAVERPKVGEKIEDQIYRSLYEFLFAYEQIEAERMRRFGPAGARKERFISLLERALARDPYVRVRVGPRTTELEVRNSLGDDALYTAFPLVDR